MLAAKKHEHPIHRYPEYIVIDDGNFIGRHYELADAIRNFEECGRSHLAEIYALPDTDHEIFPLAEARDGRLTYTIKEKDNV